MIEMVNNNPQGNRLTARPKNRWWNCVQTGIDKYRIKNWKERSKTGLTAGKSIKKAEVRLGM
jgi:hypothetical protein